jgi:hypothetical protein
MTRKWKAAAIKRGGKRQKLIAIDIYKQYLESLKEIGRRMEETSSDCDRIFLLNRLPAVKKPSPLDNVDFRVEVQETLGRKLRRLAVPEFQLITYPSTSSASPSVFEYSVNSQISLLYYTSASTGSERNVTGSSALSVLAPSPSIQTVTE